MSMAMAKQTKTKKKSKETIKDRRTKERKWKWSKNIAGAQKRALTQAQKDTGIALNEFHCYSFVVKVIQKSLSQPAEILLHNNGEEILLIFSSLNVGDDIKTCRKVHMCMRPASFYALLIDSSMVPLKET